MSRTGAFAFLLAFSSSAAFAQTVAQIPDGPNKDLVAEKCTICHEPRRFLNANNNRAAWDNVVHMMINVGAPIEEGDIGKIVDYLVKAVPEQPKTPAMVIAGPNKAIFHEWQAPTPGSRPHDPLAASDGSIWWAGQMASKLGRLDPKTGEMKEFKTRIEGSGPHGIIEDRDHNIWFTANFKGYIGKLDPRTGNFTEYKLPEGTRDPHTPLLAPDGVNIFFTAQGANRVGRLNTKTGEAKVVTMPFPKSEPYGMVFDSHGVPFINEFGANKLARIDPETLEIKEIVLPNPEARPRRIAITSDDRIWYGDYARGYLGVWDPKTGDVKEYASPGGRKSRPYGITSIKDVIYYCESALGPNTIVRFDPKSEKFQTWEIPSGGGVVRNMMANPDGNLVLATSGVNGVALVELQ